MCNLIFSLRFEQGYCYLDAKCTFAHGREELEGWHKLHNLAQVQEKRLLTQSFIEKVRQRIKQEDVVSEVYLLMRLSIYGINHQCLL